MRWNPESAICNSPGHIVAEMEKPARPGEGFPGRRDRPQTRLWTVPNLREGTVGGLATFAGAWKHSRSLCGASDVPHVQRVRARLARAGGGGGWTLHVSDRRADWAVMRREAGMMWASHGGGERLKCEAGGVRAGGGTSHDAGTTQSRARAGTRHARADARVLVLASPFGSLLRLARLTLTVLFSSCPHYPPAAPPLLGGPPVDCPSC